MNTFTTIIGSGAAIAGVVSAIAWGDARVGQVDAHNAQAEQQSEQQAETSLRVGTYDPQAAFSSYHGALEHMQESQQLQQQAQEAQQRGDQQEALRIQSELQQGQEKVVERFFADVDRILPELADGRDVQVVAVDVVYTADNVDGPVDLTAEVIEKVNEGSDEEQVDRTWPPTESGRGG